MTTRRAAMVHVMAGLVAVIGLSAAPDGAVDPRSADALIREAVESRLGVDAEVTVVNLDLPARAGSEFRSVRVDPAAWLGKPMRFTLVPVSGAPVIAVASLRVVAEHVVARQAISRGETITTETVTSVRDEVRGVPLRRLPQAVQVVGGRALRPVPAGAILLPGAVTVRRAIEPGDPVTVVARRGDIEVTASLVASDGGDPGDVIRVRNPETRRDLRGRVLSEGRVEVIYAR